MSGRNAATHVHQFLFAIWKMHFTRNAIFTEPNDHRNDDDDDDDVK